MPKLIGVKSPPLDIFKSIKGVETMSYLKLVSPHVLSIFPAVWSYSISKKRLSKYAEGINSLKMF